MPAPTVRDVHIESALAGVSIAYRNTEYIADQVFPNVNVTKRSDYYFIFDKQSWFRNIVQQRAPGTRAKRVDYTLSTGSYVCVPYALAKAITDEERKNADAPLQPDVSATEFVTNALLLGREIRVADLVTGSANWAYSASPSTQWSSDTSDPIGDIQTARNNVVQTIGTKPNVAVMSWDVWQNLEVHPDLIDRVKHTRTGGIVTPNDLAGWFGFDKVLVGTAIYDAAVEGQSSSISYVWGDDFWCGYVPATPALMEPAAGYVLAWESFTVSRFREEQEKQDIIEAEHSVDEVITGSDAGGIIYNAV